MTQAETYIVGRIMAALNSLPRCWCFKVHGSMFQAAGVPDIIGVHDGVFFGVEVKTDTGKASKLQELTIRRIIEAGGRAGVARSVDEAIDILTNRE